MAVKCDTNVQDKLKGGNIPQEMDDLSGQLEILNANSMTKASGSDVLLFRTHGGATATLWKESPNQRDGPAGGAGDCRGCLRRVDRL
jgi:hypothetical protein